jgi:hypothetical protein
MHLSFLRETSRPACRTLIFLFLGTLLASCDADAIPHTHWNASSGSHALVKPV